MKSSAHVPNTLCYRPHRLLGYKHVTGKPVQHGMLGDEAKVAAERQKQSVWDGWENCSGGRGCWEIFFTSCFWDGSHKMRCSSSGRSDCTCHTESRGQFGREYISLGKSKESMIQNSLYNFTQGGRLISVNKVCVEKWAHKMRCKNHFITGAGLCSYSLQQFQWPKLSQHWHRREHLG